LSCNVNGGERLVSTKGIVRVAEVLEGIMTLEETAKCLKIRWLRKEKSLLRK